jgi:hypothetical protein
MHLTLLTTHTQARRPDDIAKLRKDAEINICNMFQFVGIFENVPDSIILYKKVRGVSVCVRVCV